MDQTHLKVRLANEWGTWLRSKSGKRLLVQDGKPCKHVPSERLEQSPTQSRRKIWNLRANRLVEKRALHHLALKELFAVVMLKQLKQGRRFMSLQPSEGPYTQT